MTQTLRSSWFFSWKSFLSAHGGPGFHVGDIKMRQSISITLMIIGFAILISGLCFAFRLSSGGLEQSSDDVLLNESAILRIPLPDSVLEIDPRTQVSMNLKAISNAVFSRLVRINEVGEVEPDLAESWSFDLTQTEVLMKIRKGVVFHDGSSLDADDVIDSFYSWLAPGALDNNQLFDVLGSEDYAAGKTKNISGLRKIGSHTVGIKLVRRFTEDFIYALTTPRFYAFKRKVIDGRVVIFGTGPFSVHRVTKRDVFLKRNAKYFGRPAKASGLIFYVRSKDKAIDDLLNGKSHALFAYSELPRKYFLDDQIKVLPVKKTSTTVLFLMNQGAGKSKEFRKSIADMFRRNRMREECFPEGSLAERIIPPGLRGSVKLTLKRDSPSARNSLPVQLPVLYTTKMVSRCLYERLREDYGRYGGSIHEFANLKMVYDYFNRGKIDFAFERLTFKSLDPTSIIQYFNPLSSEYFLREEVPELSALFRQLAQADNSNQKANVLALIDEFLVENAFVIPLHHEVFYTAHSQDLVGLAQSNFGSIVGVKWEELGLRSVK